MTRNYRDIKKYGIALESDLPYNERQWKTEAQACAHLSGMNKTRCVHGQIDPRLISLSEEELRKQGHQDLADAKATAHDSKVSFVNSMTGGIVGSTSQVKQLLRQGIPVTLFLDVYFGAWNHGGGKAYGIDIDDKLFKKGMVTYPDQGSVDRSESPKVRARHAVLVFAYDDNV